MKQHSRIERSRHSEQRGLLSNNTITEDFKMDQIIKKIAALGVPGLVFMVAIELTGLAGAAACRLPAQTDTCAIFGGQHET